MSDQAKAGVAVIVYTILVFLGGLAAGWKLYQPEKVIETPKPEVRQSDGSVILERDPDAKPEAPAPNLPAKPKRTVVVKVKPKPEPKPEPVKPGPDGFCPAPRECPALTVRLDLVDKDKGQRVIASSPDGEIVGGIDIPREPYINHKQPKWAIGATYASDKSGDNVIGGFVDRDFGPFRVGVEADQDSIRVRAGVRF